MVFANLVVVQQGKISMGVLSGAVKSIVDVFESAVGPMADVTAHLTRSLSLLEIALALVAVLLGEKPMYLLRKVLNVATWLWIITIFHDAAKAFMKFLVEAGARALGAQSDVMLQPSKILDMSTKATEPMMKKLQDMHITVDIGTAILLGLVVLLVMIAYIALALSIALAVIEFYLYNALGTLLLPFAVFGHTRFLADKAINAVIACALKLAVVSFIVSAIQPILEQVKFQPGLWNQLTWHSIWALMVVVGLCCSLALWAPRLAAGFLHASPSLSGTAMVAQAATVGAAMMVAGTRLAQSAWAASRGGYGAAASSSSSGTTATPAFAYLTGASRLQPPARPRLPVIVDSPALPPGGVV